MPALLTVVISLGIGVVIGAWLAHSRLKPKLVACQTELGTSREHWEARLQAVTHDRDQRLLVDQTLIPLQSNFSRLEQQWREEKADSDKRYGHLASQLQEITHGQQHISHQTQHLLDSLKNASVRGRWGEIQLQRLLEAAGFTEGITYVQQASVGDQLRPDVIVHLGGQRSIVIDAKAPLAALLHDTSESPASSETKRKKEHAKALRSHVRQLSSKQYQKACEVDVEFVVLFLPAEDLLSIALSVDSSLIEDAFANGVIIATPTTLLSMLKVVHLNWRNQQLHAHSAELLELTREALNRINTLHAHITKLGSTVSQAQTDYNKVTASWNQRVAPVARRIGQHSPLADSSQELASVKVVSGSELSPLQGVSVNDNAER